MQIHQLQKMLAAKGCVRILVKELAANDNSKNQVYLGGNFEAVNCFPNLAIAPDDSGTHGVVFKAPLPFCWINAAGQDFPAPTAQLILYPQYPEIRFSGFLFGCKDAPSDLMRGRLQGRVLFLGVRADGAVFGHVVASDDELANEFRARQDFQPLGVFRVVPVLVGASGDSRAGLLAELRRIHELGWIDSKRRLSDGTVVAYQAPNGGGYTLEAEFGINPNGFSEPDFLGWELKQHAVSRLDACDSGVLTLMTPEPTGGVYSDAGPIAFVQQYGHPDKSGKPDRLNFAGIHRTGTRQPTTHLEMSLRGYDAGKKGFDGAGAIVLTAPDGTEAASWPFAGLMNHWNRKHNMAAYIPSIYRIKPQRDLRQYQYGRLVRLGEGTDFLLFLAAIASGVVYYDPGIELTDASSTKPKLHRRSQFRIRSRDLKCLYKQFERVDVLTRQDGK